MVAGFRQFGVLEGAAADGVDGDKDNHHYNVKNGYLLPVPPHIFKHRRFARIAVVAQHRRVVVPPRTIRVLRLQRCSIVARWRVVLQVVLLVHLAGDLGDAAVAGDDEPENGDSHKSGDEEQHDEKVEPEGPRDAKTRADESGERDNEDHESDDEKRRLEELLAGCAAPRHP
nr:hypothetical protein MIMGU_mgv1a013325mg [Ipomoea batatas]